MFCHRSIVQGLIALLVALCWIGGAENAENDAKANGLKQDPFIVMEPLQDALRGHVDKFKKLRDDLKALQNSKENTNPLAFFRETMRIMEGLQSLGQEWKDIERLQDPEVRRFENVLEEMDPRCGMLEPRAAIWEIKLRCLYTNLNGNPYYLIGPLKQEQVNLTPFTATIYRDLLTAAEVRRAHETRRLEPSVRRRLQTVVPNVFNLAVREVSKEGYNGSRVKHRGYSAMLYLETNIAGGISLFQEGLFTVEPTSGSLLVSEHHPSICPSRHSLNVITNFNVMSKSKSN
uniref:Prolyl 4-hydroxylase alpha-subunit N-terminal domain-containing protein n=1 Tax=Anopheles dirus TaxID=7168 RepID=A0A182NTD5_9DIPT